MRNDPKLESLRVNHQRIGGHGGQLRAPQALGLELLQDARNACGDDLLGRGGQHRLSAPTGGPGFLGKAGES